MEPDGTGLIGGILGALTGLMGWGDSAPPPVFPMPGATVIELRVNGDTLSLSPEQIETVQPDIDEQTGAPQIGLTLSSDAALQFGQITAAHVGERMDLSVCGDVVMSPIIQTPILGGQIVIMGGFTVEETETYARIIAGDVPCAPETAETETK